MSHIEKAEHCYEKLEFQKRHLCDWVDAEISKGRAHVNAQELGEAVDMIKDLAEAQRDIWEACYYKSVSEAMEEYSYNPRMGYKSSKSNTWNRMKEYPMNPMIPREMMHSEDEYYDEDEEMEKEYGRNFNNFRKAKKHYTQTHAPQDQQKMKEHANMHLNQTIGTFREIWSDADPELRRKMKTDLSNLVNEMAV